MHLSPFKRRNCQSASFRSKKIADSPQVHGAGVQPDAAIESVRLVARQRE
jgi:hypothetical protein